MPPEPIGGSQEILTLFLSSYNPEDVVDLGGGGGRLVPLLAGRKLEIIDCQQPAAEFYKICRGLRYEVADLRTWRAARKYGAAITSHTIEHMANTERFLQLFFSTIGDGAPWCIIWPPPKPEIVSGHVHVFNLGLMMMNIVRLGIDCRKAVLAKKGYSLGVMSRKAVFRPPAPVPGTFELVGLGPWFPFPVVQGFNGDGNLGEMKL